MNEQEWLGCIDSSAMLHFLHERSRRRKVGASDRKFRLFYCARCRKQWSALADKRSRRAVEVAEKFADGLASKVELRTAEKIAKAAMDDAFAGSDPDAQSASLLAWWSTFSDAGLRAWQEPGLAADYHDWCQEEAADYPDPSAAARAVAILRVAEALERAYHAQLLHDLFGNPFRRVALSRSWLTPQVLKLAQAIYSRRVFDRMPALADALEEAGCTSEGILQHCRQLVGSPPGTPGEHVRGCWIVDALLERE